LKLHEHDRKWLLEFLRLKVFPSEALTISDSTLTSGIMPASVNHDDSRTYQQTALGKN